MTNLVVMLLGLLSMQGYVEDCAVYVDHEPRPTVAVVCRNPAGDERRVRVVGPAGVVIFNLDEER